MNEQQKRKREIRWAVLFSLILLIGIFGAYRVWRWYRALPDGSNDYIYQWLTDPSSHDTLNSPVFFHCPNAPFLLPTEGFIGLLWNDPAAPYDPSHRHTAIDIFGYGELGTVPVYSVYDGWLTRREDWHSTVIIRHNDPLQEGRTIWTYYTHMASSDGDESYVNDAFPPGTYNVFIPQGTLLGFQGNYNPPFPIAMHLHISIVTSAPDGSYNNEAILSNTLDPSPYFGMDLNAETQSDRPVSCLE